MGAQRPTMMSTCMLQVTWVSPGGGTRATNRGNVSFALVYMGFGPLCVGATLVWKDPPPSLPLSLSMRPPPVLSCVSCTSPHT
jgi:hypothetical protein